MRINVPFACPFGLGVYNWPVSEESTVLSYLVSEGWTDLGLAGVRAEFWLRKPVGNCVG